MDILEKFPNGFFAHWVRKSTRYWLILGIVLSVLGVVLLFLARNMIVTKPTQEGGFFGGTFAIILGIGLWVLISALRFRRNPAANPLGRELARHGALEQVVPAFDGEIGDRRQPYMVTRNWVISAGQFGIKAWHLRDVVWAYQTTKRINGLPLFMLTLHNRDDKKFELPFGALRQNGNERVQEQIQHIAQVAPWVKLGYSEENRKRWAKDRTAFLAEVDVRRPAQV